MTHCSSKAMHSDALHHTDGMPGNPAVKDVHDTMTSDFDPDERVAFIFTGQGSQYLGMGEPLYKEDKHFRDAMDRCESAYRSATGGTSLLDKMFRNAKSSVDEDGLGKNLARTENA